MPAPVSNSVFPAWWPLSSRAEIVEFDLALIGSNEGLKKSTSAAMAPLAVVALDGIMRGAGSGSVYGTRRSGARISQTHTEVPCVNHGASPAFAIGVKRGRRSGYG